MPKTHPGWRTSTTCRHDQRSRTNEPNRPSTSSLSLHTPRLCAQALQLPERAVESSFIRARCFSARLPAANGGVACRATAVLRTARSS